MIKYAILLAVMASCSLLAGEKAPGKNLDELLVKVKAALPKGWDAKLWPDKDADFEKSWGGAPRLTVYRKEKVEGYHVGVNMMIILKPDGSGQPYEMMDVEFEFSCVPFMTKEQWQEARKVNSEKIKERKEANNRLEGVTFRGHMGPAPAPPRAYKPESELGRSSLREYLLVWNRTKPKRLPDCSYKNLSFISDLEEMTEFKDAAVKKEVDQARATVMKLFERYDKLKAE